MNLGILIPVGVSLLLAGFNVAVWCITKFNDMAHLEGSTKRIENKLEDMDKKLDSLGERISFLEGKVKSRKR